MKKVKNVLKMVMFTTLVGTLTGCGLLGNHLDKPEEKVVVKVEESEKKEETKQTQKIERNILQPKIEARDIVINKDTEADFTTVATVEDEEMVYVTFVGDYDKKTAGIYPMNAVVVDQTGNTSHASFHVIVKEEPQPTVNNEENVQNDEVINKVVKANQELENAKKALEELEKEIAEKQAKKVATEAEVETKKEELAKLQAQIDGAKETFEQSKKNYEEAIIRATESPAFKQAKEEVDAKTVALEQSIQKETEASEAFSQAQQAHETALLAKESAISNAAKKETTKKETAKAVDQAKAELEKAKEEAAKANANKEEATKAIEVAQANYDQAVTKQEEAKKAYEEAKKLESNYDSRLAEAQQALANAQAKVDEAQAVIDQGSYGYFAYKGNKMATDVIDLVLAYQDAEDTTMTENMRTNLGDKKDATGLNNFEEAIEIIRRGNELRAQDDNFVSEGSQKPLLITDTMMAIAQVRANASEGYMNHWQYLRTQGYNVGENLAWSYDDPQRGWYTEEKLVYDWFQDNGYNIADINKLPQEVLERCVKETGIPGVDWIQVGHYNNLMLEDYTVTGAATDGNYPTTSQEFAYTAYQKGILDKTYTVDEYLADFLAYKNYVEKNLLDAEEAKKVIQARIDQLQENKGLTDEEKAIVEEAANLLEMATVNTNQALEKVQEAKDSYVISEAEVVNKNAVVEEKEQVLNTKVAEDGNAGAELLDALENQSTATEAVTTTETAMTEAKTNLEESKKDVEQAQLELEQATSEMEQFDDSLVSAQDEMNHAQETLTTLENQYSEVEKEVTDTEARLNVLREEIEQQEVRIIDQQRIVVEMSEEDEGMTEQNEEVVTTADVQLESNE